MRVFKRKEPNYEYDLRKLEMQLKATLQPISPRSEFVQELGAKILEKDIKIGPKFLISGKVSNGLLVAGGVVGSIIMIITSIRGLISIIGVIGYLFRFINKETQRQQISPV